MVMRRSENVGTFRDRGLCWMKATGAGWWESLQDRALLGPPGLFYQADPGRIDEVF